MAEQDDAQKTEDPTHKKLEDSHKKGEVPKSQEMKTWFMFLAATILWAATGPAVGDNIYTFMRGWFSGIHMVPTDKGGMESLAADATVTLFLIIAVPLAVFIVAALAGNLLQHKPVFTFEKIKPKLNKISPLSGLKRLYSANTLVEFGKVTAKLIIVGGIAFAIVWPNREILDLMPSTSIQDMLAFVDMLGFRLLLGVTIAVTVIAVVDFTWQKYQHTKKLRMTKQEVKDEHKQTEGDPHVKARLRQVRAERARQRMMAAVPQADVVLTNPTHYSVALEYRHGEMEVPKLTAKGADKVAFRIRELAEEHNIPIIENPPLTRALFASVELDEDVPPEHYKAVAEVIGYVMKLRKAGITPKAPRPDLN